MKTYTLDDLVEVTYQRNHVWRLMMSKKSLKDFFTRNIETTVVVTDALGIVGLGVYVKTIPNEIHFVTLTGRENKNLVPHILSALHTVIKKEKTNRVSWLDRDYKYKGFNVKCLPS